MNRRTLLQTVGGGVLAGGVLSRAGIAQSAGGVTETFALPEDGGRGMGVIPASGFDDRDDPMLLCSFLGGNWYWIDPRNGGFPRDGTFDITAQGTAASDAGPAWAIGPDLREYNEEGRERFSIPSQGYALAYDERADQLWGGSREGRLWKFDTRGQIVQSFDMGGSVYGLAHDGTKLWAGVVDRGLLRVDPATGTVQSRVEYPPRVFENDGQVYDLAFGEGVLWILGGDTLFRTDIGGSASTEPPTETPTERRTNETAQLCLTQGGEPIDRADPIPEGLSRRVRLEVREFDPGFAGADLTVRFPSVVEPTAIEAGNAFEGQRETAIDGNAVRLRVADVSDAITATDDRFVLGTVVLDGVTEGSGQVTIQSQAVDADGGSAVELSLSAACDELGVASEQTCPTVGGQETTDPDGDGQCEDLNGNGRTDFDDVTSYFEQLDADGVRNNVGAFDFNENGRIDFDDVNALFEEVS